MAPQIFLGVDSIQHLHSIYPEGRFHIWHIPEINSGILLRIKGLLGHRIVSQNVYTQGMPNLPTLKKFRCDSAKLANHSQSVLLGIGGGSLMDFLKVIRFQSEGLDWLEHQLDQPLDKLTEGISKQRLVLMPTTAGTGSEVTGSATVWDFSEGCKHSFYGSEVFADIAIVDPQLTYQTPWELTRDSGLDALSHALESIWNRNSILETQELAISACHMICRAIDILKNDLTELSARNEISYGAHLAGLAIARTQTALAHALSYEDTIDQKISHGYACASWLPVVWQIMLESNHYQSIAPSLESAVGQFFTSPEQLKNWLLGLGVNAHDPMNITVKQRDRILRVKESSRGKNFIGFNH